MQPNQVVPPGEENSDPAKFDFILKDKPKSVPNSKLPMNLAGPAKIFAILAVVLIVILVVFVVFGNKSTGSKQVVDLMAQTQEISRVSALVDQQFKDAGTTGLAATTEESLATQQIQFAAYLKKVKVKYTVKDLVLRTNKNTDTQLQAATQSNSLDNVYVAYLKTSLTTYQNSIADIYKTTKSKTLKDDLQSAYNSNAMILKSPQFAALASGN